MNLLWSVFQVREPLGHLLLCKKGAPEGALQLWAGLGPVGQCDPARLFSGLSPPSQAESPVRNVHFLLGRYTSASQHSGSRVGERPEDPQHSVCELIFYLPEPAAVPGVVASPLPQPQHTPSLFLVNRPPVWCPHSGIWGSHCYLTHFHKTFYVRSHVHLCFQRYLVLPVPEPLGALLLFS